MKIQGRKFVSLSCALAISVSSFTTFAQSAQQDKTQDNNRKVEKVQQREMIIVQTDGSGGKHEFNIQVPPPPEMAGGFGGFAFGDSTFQFISSELSFSNKVVRGAPYSADAVTERVQTLADGNRIVRRDTAQVWRDSEGRTRREQAVTMIGPLAAGADAPRLIHINDPVAGVSYILNPKDRTASKVSFRVAAIREGLSMKTAAGGEAFVGNIRVVPVSGGVLQGNALRRVQPAYPPVAKAARAQGPVQVTVTINENGEVTDTSILSGHPLLRDAAINAARQWRFKPTLKDGSPVKVQGTLTFNFTLQDDDQAQSGEPKEDHLIMHGFGNGILMTNRTPKKESLGEQTIEGLKAEGTRWTTTIPTGEIGNERPIEIVNEVWYSPELQVELMRRFSDPRTGETIYKLININRSEPDKSLFEVPSDYTLKEGPGGALRWNYRREEK
ncbi:MAG TPA: energy transducer TonB [Blastocatellia bacterium]|nr:energy transducer TonB [Blastocatellia bacterium]